MWDQLLDDKAVRRWLSPPAGVVLCIGAESLSGHGDDAAAFMRQRLLTVRNRLGNAPVCLLVTGLEHAPGRSDGSCPSADRGRPCPDGPLTAYGKA